MPRALSHYASPVFGDSGKGLPQNLTQGGTKEILLSKLVWLYKVLDKLGQTFKLDLYEGMRHALQRFGTGSGLGAQRGRGFGQ